MKNRSIPLGINSVIFGCCVFHITAPSLRQKGELARRLYSTKILQLLSKKKTEGLQFPLKNNLLIYLQKDIRFCRHVPGRCEDNASLNCVV